MSTRNSSLIQRLQNQGAYRLYAPSSVTDPISDLGSAEGPSLEEHNGAALSSPGIVEGGASVLLDGVDDYLGLGVETRENWVTDPIFLNPLIANQWDGLNSTLSRKEGELPEGLGKGMFATFPIAAEGVQEGLTTSTKQPVVAGERVDLGVFAEFPLEAKARLSVFWYKANEDALPPNIILVNFTGTGALKWVTGNLTAPAEAAFVLLRVSTSSSNSVAGTGRVWGVMIEKGRTTPITAAEQFPRPAQYASGLAADVGERGKSNIGIGPFATGADRTWPIFTQRTSTAAVDVLMGSSDGSFIWRCEAGSNDISLTTDGGESWVTWKDAMPGTEPALLVLVIDSSAKTAELYVGAESKGTKEFTGFAVAPGSTVWIGGTP